MAVVVDVAHPADDGGIRRLLRQQVIPGHIRLAFPREPDFSLGCSVTGDEYRILVARSQSDGAVVGVACRSVRQVYVNGRPQRLGYLGQLRIHERFRGRWLVSRGFALLHRMDEEDPVPAYLAAVVDGNREALGVLVNRRRRSFPQFRGVARYRTLALPTRKSKRPVKAIGEIGPGSTEQLPEIVRFLRAEGPRRQLFPVWTEASLRSLRTLGLRPEDIRVARRHGDIVGVTALWDQSAYKQTIVHGYSVWMRALARISRLTGRWLPLPSVPGAGREIRSASAALVCIKDDDPEVFADLLRQIYDLACSRSFDYLLVGLESGDPLLKVARAARHFTYSSRLFLVSWKNGGSYEQLDDRPVYVDIGSL